MVMNNTNYGLRVSAVGVFDEAGSVVVAGVLPGDYRPSIVDPTSAIPRGWWLRSVLVGGRDVLDAPLVVEAADVRDVVFAYSDRHSELGGRITDAAGRSASGYDVVVISADRAHWTTGARRTRHTRPASDGRFAFADLPAGDYLLAMLDDLDPADLDDAAFLEQLAAAAVRVTVADGERTTQDLQMGGTGLFSTDPGVEVPGLPGGKSARQNFRNSAWQIFCVL
jgi:hypothetical protein